jgi:hypothetical protein
MMPNAKANGASMEKSWMSQEFDLFINLIQEPSYNQEGSLILLATSVDLLRPF